MPLRLYDALDIHPDDHQVLDVVRPEQSDIGLGVRRLFSNILWGLLFSGLSLAIHLALNPIVMEETWSEPWLTVAGITWLITGVCTLTIAPYFIWTGIKSLLASMRTPNLSTPTDTVSSFLRAVTNDLAEQAYLLLTAQAQRQARLELEAPEPLRDTIEPPEWQDVAEFDRFWSPFRIRELKATVDRAEVDMLDQQTARVRVPMTMEYPGKKETDLTFFGEFVAVERRGRWFLANGFVWPVEPVVVKR